MPFVSTRIALLKRWLSVFVAVASSAGGLAAQGSFDFPRMGGPFPGDRSGTRIWIEGGGWVDEATVKTARETASHSTGTPDWTNPREFSSDVFTFARAIFRSERRVPRRGPVFGWFVDYPDADLNLSYRLQQLTSMKVDPDGRVLHLTDPTLSDFPLIYMVHTEDMLLRDDEVSALRNYLMAGGALLVSDYWGTDAWNNFSAEMRRVLPEKSWVDIPMDHPVFNCIYKISGPMNELQIPTLQYWVRSHDPKDPNSRITVDRGVGSENVAVKALLDERGRIMVFSVHNSDISDGWEREGENADYFRELSEKRAYPLAINLIFYLMTH
ncbi:MAG: DUF4159 domain-containing protein [Opitutaceae bacterium]|nr:DUF4159 domain-containing protein [Opitutaceae bacterium]